MVIATPAQQQGAGSLSPKAVGRRQLPPKTQDTAQSHGAGREGLGSTVQPGRTALPAPPQPNLQLGGCTLRAHTLMRRRCRLSRAPQDHTRALLQPHAPRTHPDTCATATAPPPPPGARANGAQTHRLRASPPAPSPPPPPPPSPQLPLCPGARAQTPRAPRQSPRCSPCAQHRPHPAPPCTHIHHARAPRAHGHPPAARRGTHVTAAHWHPAHPCQPRSHRRIAHTVHALPRRRAGVQRHPVCLPRSALPAMAPRHPRRHPQGACVPVCSLHPQHRPVTRSFMPPQLCPHPRAHIIHTCTPRFSTSPEQQVPGVRRS